MLTVNITLKIVRKYIRTLLTHGFLKVLKTHVNTIIIDTTTLPISELYFSSCNYLYYIIFVIYFMNEMARVRYFH